MERERRDCPPERPFERERLDGRAPASPCVDDDGEEDERFADVGAEPLEDDSEDDPLAAEVRFERFSELEEDAEDERGELEEDWGRDGEERSGAADGRVDDEEGEGAASDEVGPDEVGPGSVEDDADEAPSPERSSSRSTFTSKTTLVVRPTDWWTALDSSRLKRLRRYWAVKLLGTSSVSVVFPPFPLSKEAG